MGIIVWAKGSMDNKDMVLLPPALGLQAGNFSVGIPRAVGWVLSRTVRITAAVLLG
jgi:hypothetical protein